MFSPKQILSHRKATKAGTALAVVIKAELVEKQKMIDRLLDEASARQDAIDLCGDEIRALRGEVDSWKSKAQDAFLEIRAHENSVKESSRYVQAKLLVKEDLISLSRTTLIEIILELSKQCREMGMKYNEMSERYAEGQSARNMYAEQQQKLQDLSDAHLQQSYFVQQLQKKVSKMDTYRPYVDPYPCVFFLDCQRLFAQPLDPPKSPAAQQDAVATYVALVLFHRTLALHSPFP